MYQSNRRKPLGNTGPAPHPVFGSRFCSSVTFRLERRGSLAVPAAYPDGVEYLQEARSLWQTSVPRCGQAATVQGELLRAVEKLRDEAQRNGNLNWGSGQEAFIAYLRENLIGSALFGQAAAQEIEADLDRLGKFEYPETSELPYGRLTDRVIEWCHAHPEPVPHTRNPHLHI
jgi:hypothetical protein